jgi:hypothetical protein
VDDRRRLREHVLREAGFRITTVDGLNWICPYTLVLVPAPFDVVTTACDHLLATKPWTTAKPQPTLEILTVRWSHFLRERWELEPRLHLHSQDGQWLNPWTGTFAPITDKQPPAALATQLARHLAQLPQAQLAQLRPAHELEATLRQRNAACATIAAAPPPAQTKVPSQSWQRPASVGAGAPPPSSAGPAAGAVLGSIRSGIVPPPAKIAGDNPASTVDRSQLGDMGKARAVLDRMLPHLPVLPGFKMAIEYEAVQGIGGDFYDFLPIANGRWLIVIGDVSGHGAEAALIVTSTLKALRLLAPGTPDLVGLLAKLNDNIQSDLPSGHFITMWAAVLDPAAATLDYVCAGHHPALLLSLRRQATLQQLGRRGMAIGLVQGGDLRQRLTVGTVQLEPGDVVVQFTDGLFEINSPAGVEFGRLRTMGSCIANIEQAPEAMAARMVREVKKFSAGALEDDLTLLVISVETPPGGLPAP